MRAGSSVGIAQRHSPFAFSTTPESCTRRAFFDAWAEPFAKTYGSHPALRERMALFAREGRAVLNDFAGTGPLRCLDLGCGPGLIASTLGELGFEVVGIDRSEAMIRAARRICTKNGIAQQRTSFITSDLTDYLRSSRETFDLIVSSSVLEYLHDPIEVVRLVAPRLRPAGTFAFSIPNFDSILRIAEPWIERLRRARPRCRSFWGNALRTTDYAAFASELGFRFEREETFGLPRLPFPGLEPVFRNRWFQTMSLLIFCRKPHGDSAQAHPVRDTRRESSIKSSEGFAA